MTPAGLLRLVWNFPFHTSQAQRKDLSFGTTLQWEDTPLVIKHSVSPRLFLNDPIIVLNSNVLAAANDVENEGLAPNFSGILGLALPLNSIIATDIPPVTNNNPDGAAWASNLFSLTPVSTAPSSRFLSLALSRPGSNTIPAVFGIGRHPSSIVSDPSLVQYSTLIADKPGILFWKVSVRAITVYVNGTRKMVQLPRSITDASSPVAVLDSGVSVILTTSEIADGIYGAIGINPASDGMCMFLSFMSFSEILLSNKSLICHVRQTMFHVPHLLT